MADLAEHLADAYELPVEWQQWLDSDDPDETPVEVVHSDGTRDTLLLVPTPPDTPWRIENDHVATWALRKLAGAEAEQGRVKELAAVEIQRIEEWEEQAMRRPTRDAEFFRGHLVAYWRRQVEEMMGPYLERGMTPEEAWEQIKKKSLSLPSGRLTARRAPAGVEVVDQDGFIRWAEQNGYTDLIRSSPKPALDALKKLPVVDGEICVPMGETDETGEPQLLIVPGVKVKPTDFHFDAKPDVDA